MSMTPRSDRALLPRLFPRNWSLWLDGLAIAAWGILLLKYWLTGKLRILIHPAYTWLCVVGGIGLLAMGGLKLWEVWQIQRQNQARGNGLAGMPEAQHVTLLPSGGSAMLLLVVAIIGLMSTPRAFASQTAMERGVTELLSATRSQPQRFRSAKKPEERSLLDWVRTLNVYPEPDAYAGQNAKVQGFVIPAPESWSDGYFIVSRFVITCCAADAYPVGLPVKLTGDLSAYPPDTWLDVEGTIVTETLDETRKLVIQASAISEIPEPKNPYDY